MDGFSNITLRPVQTSIGQTITFGAHGNARQFQLDGWSGPESDWTWTIGGSATILIPAPQAPHGYYLEIDATPALHWPTRPSQPVIISANDERIAVIDLRESCRFAVRFPSPAYSWIAVRFDIPNSFRPCDFGINGDTRDIGLMFKRIRVLPLLAPAPDGSQKYSGVRVSGNTAEEAIRAAEAAVETSIHELLTSFDMLAGNCSFGLTQRSLGCDPLGLLRFSGASPSVSIDGLECGFENIGVEIEAVAAWDGSDEWMVHDIVGLRYHSGKTLDVPTDKVVSDERKKIPFLRRKFFNDLSEASKVFIYHDLSGAPFEAAVALFLALRRVSSADMLWVRPYPFAHPADTVREVLPGLYMGFMDQIAPPMIGKESIGGWLSILANAFLLRNRIA
jgi:hypothetical protein